MGLEEEDVDKEGEEGALLADQADADEKGPLEGVDAAVGLVAEGTPTLSHTLVEKDARERERNITKKDI